MPWKEVRSCMGTDLRQRRTPQLRLGHQCSRMDPSSRSLGAWFSVTSRLVVAVARVEEKGSKWHRHAIRKGDDVYSAIQGFRSSCTRVVGTFLKALSRSQLQKLLQCFSVVGSDSNPRKFSLRASLTTSQSYQDFVHRLNNTVQPTRCRKQRLKAWQCS